VAPPVHKNAFEVEYLYTIYGTGDIALRTTGKPVGTWPACIPRLGLEMALPGALDQVAWYGLGPGETYPDSRQAGRMGVYRATVDELLTPYVRPQENGNRSDVRWVALTDLRGAGFLVAGSPALNFSAHRHTARDFTEARHVCDLRPRDSVTLNLDYRQRGLGSRSCGPDVLPQYELKAEQFVFEVRLAPLDYNRIAPAELSRRRFEM
jgi:beta-galactosidase/evolved beta-galactosidase subunit alpha